MLPLFVDLDGTLIKSDVSFETFVALLKKNPFYFFAVLFWLLKGRPYMKRQIAERVDIDVALLPYNVDFLNFLRQEKDAGRRLILASASDPKYVRAVADHLGLFEGVVVTDENVNCSGTNKLVAMQKYCPDQDICYAGNSYVDRPIWLKIKESIVVSHSKSFISGMQKSISFANVFHYDSGRYSLLKALRPYQWSKNILLFVPLVLSHRVMDSALVLNALLGFAAFCACASAIYVVNDLCDLQADRRHLIKRNRPIAAGDVSVKSAMLIVPFLLFIAFFISLRLPEKFAYSLLLYVAVTLLYSIRLKQIALVDIIVLALLYVIRVLAGGMACGVFVSEWLLSFSLFIFTSLACLKRFSELKALKVQKQENVPGRGYLVNDIEPVAQFGTASAFVSLLVLVFYVNSKEVVALYPNHQYLWLLCPLVMFWVMRVWLLAYRGKVNEDPVVFALRDRASYLVGLGLVVILLIALRPMHP